MLKRYDRIPCLPSKARHFTGPGDFYTSVIAKLFSGEGLGKRALTYEIGAHLPLWVQVRTG